MINKNFIQQNIDALGNEEFLTIYFQGFQGRGINGVSENTTAIGKYANQITLYDSNDKVANRYVHHELHDDYLSIKSIDTSYRYREFTTVIPYSMITHLVINHDNPTIKKNKK